MKKFRILIVPSSDDEGLFENSRSFEEAVKIHEKKETATDTFSFDTEKERDLFLEGYAAGIGYLGNGMFFKST